MTHELASLFRYEVYNVIRARWLIFYGAFFAAFSAALLQFTADPGRAVVSLLSLVLLFVPMISVLYASVYWYGAGGFTHLLLTQPLRRSSVFLARWLALSLALSITFIGFTGASLAINRSLGGPTLLLLILGGILTLVFVGMGMLISVLVKDRMKGIGLTFVVWLYFAILHDALVFFVLNALKDYPIEVPGMVLMSINPIDLARVLMLLVLDLAAMMGYTGRILQTALSGPPGKALSLAILLMWMVAPLLLGMRAFKKKDL